MRDVMFVLSGLACVLGGIGLLGEFLAFANANNPEAGGAMMLAIPTLYLGLPVLAGIAFCYWKIRITLKQREKFSVWGLAAPQFFSLVGLAIWLLLGNR
jgi:hypothetical protein